MNEAMLSLEIEIISLISFKVINLRSKGSVINFSISLEDMPSYLIITATVFKSISGISSLGKVAYEIVPKRIIIRRRVEIVFFLSSMVDNIFLNISYALTVSGCAFLK